MNQKYQIIIQLSAQKAIEEAYFWLSNDSSRKARRWLEGLYQTIFSLENMPYRCSLAYENDFFDEEIKSDNLVTGKDETPIGFFLLLLIIAFKLFLCDTLLKNR